MRTLNDVRQAIGVAEKELLTLAGDATAYAAKEAELAELDAEEQRLDKAMKRSAAGAQPVGGDNPDVTETRELVQAQAATIGRNTYARDFGMHGIGNFSDYLSRARVQVTLPEKDKRFQSFGEQLQAIFQHYKSGGSVSDNRLVRAPTGAGEVDPTGGGFLIQVDFARAVWMLAHDMGEILGACNTIPVSANANGLKIPGVDETSRATGSRWGGVSSSWVDEGTQPTPSRPKFRMVEFGLKKLMSVMYTSDEMLQDSTALTAIAGQAFSEEVMFMTEDAIYEGSGAGQPLGIINSPSLVTVAKSTGQAADTIVKENIDNMWARCWARSRKRAAWYINQDCEPQLNSLSQIVGVGGVPVYLPPGGLSQSPYGILYGRPVIATEYSAALGTPGDIVLADFSQYTIVDKGGVQAATSMHVAFLTDQNVFRITYRVDGKPMWSAPLTPFKGSLTKSPFVALAAR